MEDRRERQGLGNGNGFTARSLLSQGKQGGGRRNLPELSRELKYKQPGDVGSGRIML